MKTPTKIWFPFALALVAVSFSAFAKNISASNKDSLRFTTQPPPEMHNPSTDQAELTVKPDDTPDDQVEGIANCVKCSFRKTSQANATAHLDKIPPDKIQNQ